MDCPFSINIVAGQGVEGLVVRKMQMLHTCKLAGDKNAYRLLPRQRRPDHEEERMILDVKSCKGNTKALVSKLNEERNKFITGKDIGNLVSRSKIVSQEGTEVERLIKEMEKYKDSSIMITEEEKEIETIFFQTEEMREIYEEYPEMIFVDSTYKINQNRMALMVIMIVDGNGESGCVGLAFLRTESEKCTKSALESLTKCCPCSHEKTQLVMADKDMGNRNAFQSVSKIVYKICKISHDLTLLRYFHEQVYLSAYFMCYKLSKEK